MTIKKFGKVLVPLALSGVLLLSGCGGSSNSTSGAQRNSAGKGAASKFDAVATEEAIAYDDADYEYNGGIQSSNASADMVKESAQTTTNRKLIRTINMDIETQEYDAIMASIEGQINALGGYIENMDSYNGSRYSSYSSKKNASITIRIPKDKLDTFLSMIAEQSNVIRRNESVDDVTLSYVDMESHKKALQTEYDRLLVLLDNAVELSDIIVLEERLSNVRYQIESMESQLRTYDNKVEYSTVYLSISEVEVFTPVKEETSWEKISNGFMESVRNVRDGLIDFAIGVIIALPYLAVWAVVIIAIIFIIKGFIKLGKKKKEKKVKKMMEKASAQNAANIDVQRSEKTEVPKNDK